MQRTTNKTEFEQWAADAKASGRPFRRVLDVGTKEFYLEYLTDDEIREAQARTMMERTEQTAREATRQAAREKLRALGITINDIQNAR